MNKELMNRIARHASSGVLTVLRGFSAEDAALPAVQIGRTIDNKFARMMEIIQMPAPVIFFDEFVCLYDLILMQFRSVVILDNGLYHNLFPVAVQMEPQISSQLLAHFDPDVRTNEEIDNLNEYTNIYSNYLLTDCGLACCYNIAPDQLKHEKIMQILLPENVQAMPLAGEEEAAEHMVICDDRDYFRLVQKLYGTAARYAVSWESCIFGKGFTRTLLENLNGFFCGRLSECSTAAPLVPFTHNEEITDLLKRYWGYDSFRDIRMYDLDEVENGRKKVVQVSQEQIISDLVAQAENCLSGKNFRDVFVTAPTGSGKSVMFQLPAMYLAEKYQLLTLVITPLIGLMNDQIQSLRAKGYTGARTINSDISPVVKQEILEEVASGKCHILYLSPESLLSHSDIEQMIGHRRIGMLVVDEAHIVTTWGKQFRPDYWYLGDHVQKLRRKQALRTEEPSPFIVATFTATAIYEGHEDMYHETVNSLHMIDPITYLGYVKRDNITIEVSKVAAKTNKTEYEMDKFDALIEKINLALMRNQKTLIYFPTVQLINSFYEYCFAKGLEKYVVRYHGQLDADQKNESFYSFLNGEKPIMLATKAFGMGIDIPDITNVIHFAPTGNVCDYMQEIGRAARDEKIQGHAVYQHMPNDFKHINRLHGLSSIQPRQLVDVMKKVLEIYTGTRYQEQDGRLTKKRNEMLVDAESFSYIFDTPAADDNDMVNKVKTAMLLIQKDYERRGFAPFYMRPVPMFTYGFFAIEPQLLRQLNKKFRNTAEVICPEKNICKVDLKQIWDSRYSDRMSFPKFKYLLYSKSRELDFNREFPLDAAMSVELFFEQQFNETYEKTVEAIKSFVSMSIYQGKYLSMDTMVQSLVSALHISRYKAESVISVVLAAMDTYKKEYSEKCSGKLYQTHVNRNSEISYQFLTAANGFFSWLRRNFRFIVENTQKDKLYIVNVGKAQHSKEMSTVLGLLESFGVLRFKSLGGSNSQLYIYVNETKTMQMVRQRPGSYRNRLLEMVGERHEESVRMLTYLFQSGFTSDQIWEHLENYFLGILPKELQKPEA